MPSAGTRRQARPGGGHPFPVSHRRRWRQRTARALGGGTGETWCNITLGLRPRWGTPGEGSLRAGGTRPATDRRGSGDPHREKSHWDFSRPSCAVFSGTQGRGTLSLLTCRFGQALNGRHRRPAPLQAFCKKLDQKLLIPLYRTRLGQPAQNPGGRSPEGFSWPAVPTAPARARAPSGNGLRCGLGREGPGTAPGSAGTAAAKTTGCSRTWGRSGAQTRTPAGNS